MNRSDLRAKRPTAFRDGRGYRYDARGFPILGPSSLGPPGLLVAEWRPFAPHTEHYASCLACRRLILALAIEGVGFAAVAMHGLDRLGCRSTLRLLGAWVEGQEFAPPCPGCPGGSPHFIEIGGAP